MSTGIDLGSTGLKLIQVRGLAGKLAVTGAARWIPESAAALQNGGAAEALHDMIRRAPAPPVPAVVGLTGKEVNLQYTTLPPVAPHIFRAMMRHELEAIAGPGGAGEVFVDYCITAEPDKKKGREGQYTVVIGRAKRQAVEDRLGLATAVGLRSVDACPNSIALYQAAVAGGQGKDNETVLALDLGAENLEFVLLQGRRLLFARNVSTGAKVFTESIRGALNVSAAEAERTKVRHADVGASPGAEPIEGLAAAVRTAAGQLSSVVESSIKFARVQLKEPTLKPTRCLLSGGGARLKGLREYLQGSLGIPVEWNEPFKALDCSGLPEDVARGLQAAPTDMALALGLALAGSPRGAAVRLSLLPTGQKQARVQRRQRILTIAAAAIYLAGLTTLVVAARRDRAQAQEELDQTQQRLREYGEKVQEFEALRRKQARREAQAGLLQNEVLVGRAAIESISRLQRLLPAGMWVSSISLDRSAAPEGEAPCAGVELKILGLADEGMHKDTYNLFRKIAAELEDPAAGVKARPAQYTGTPPPPGWRGFEFNVCIPAKEPVDEEPKPEEGEEQPGP